MKNIFIATLGIIAMISLGRYGMQQQLLMGPFFMFVGVCTSIGLTLDIIALIRTRLRKNNLRKYGL